MSCNEITTMHVCETTHHDIDVPLRIGLYEDHACATSIVYLCVVTLKSGRAGSLLLQCAAVRRSALDR